MTDPNTPTVNFSEFKSQLDSWANPETGKRLSTKQKRQASQIWFDQNVRGTEKFQTLSDKQQKDVMGYLNLLDPAADEILDRPVQQQATMQAHNPSIWRRTADVLSPWIDPPPGASAAAQAFAEDGVQGVGGMAGEIVGGMAGHPVKGAAIGGGLAKLGENSVQWATGSPRRPASVLEHIYEPFLAAGEEALYSKGGDVSMRALGFTKPSKHAIPGFSDLDKAARKAGTHLLPDQAATRGMATTMTGLAEASFTGGKIKRFRKILQPAALRKRTVDTMMELFGRKDVPVGQLADTLDDALTGARGAFKKQAGELYDLVTNVTGGATIDISKSKKIAGQILKDRAFLGKLGASQAGVDDLARVLDLPDTMTFTEAHQARSAVLDIIRDLDSQASFTGASKPRALRNLNAVAESLTSQMEQAAKSLSPDAAVAWKAANDFYRQGQSEFGNKLVKDLARAINNGEATKVAPIVFRSGNPDGIAVLKKHLTPDALSDLKASYIADKIKSASGLVAGDPSRKFTLSGKSFLESMPFGEIDNERVIFDMLFDKNQKNTLKQLGDLAYVMQFRGDGSGAVVVQLQQGAGAGQAIEGITQGKANLVAQGAKKIVATLSLMDMMAWMMTNKHATKILSDAVTPKRGSLHAITGALRLNRALSSYNKAKEAKRRSKLPTRENMPL
jgi:hypothetical protein